MRVKKRTLTLRITEWIGEKENFDEMDPTQVKIAAESDLDITTTLDSLLIENIINQLIKSVERQQNTIIGK